MPSPSKPTPSAATAPADLPETSDTPETPDKPAPAASPAPLAPTARMRARSGGSSPANRSLERGIALLRAFRPGLQVLGNGELAERTGLSRATVSRLSQTLVRTGFLQYEPALRAYRLGVPVLSLAHAMRTGSAVLRVAAPWMRELAQTRRINVGLAEADGDEMVYLESVRYNRKVSLRSVVAGQRVPIELTSLGRAWLAAAPENQRQSWLAALRQRRADHGEGLAAEIEEARASIARRGFCVASWQPAVLAVSTPLVLANGAIYALNASVATSVPAPLTEMAESLGEDLVKLARRIMAALAAQE